MDLTLRVVRKKFSFQCHLMDHTDAEDVEEELDIWNNWPVSKMARFSCKYCLVLLKTHKDFIAHMTQHGAGGRKSRTWNCTYCEEKLNSINGLVEHLKQSHSNVYYGDRNEKSQRKAIGRKPILKSEWCEACQKYLAPEEIKGHKVEGKCSTSRSRQIAENKYACPLKTCGKRMKTVSLLKFHFVLHLKNNPFVCQVEGCGRKFDAQCHLDVHTQFHTGELRVTCPSCKTTLASSKALRRHLTTKKACPGPQAKAKKPPLNLLLLPILKDSIKRRKLETPKNAINKIMLTDPVFIETCRENPGFRDLMIGFNRDSNLTQEKRVFRCVKCQLVFSIRKSLQKHRESCDGNINSSDESLKDGPAGESDHTFNYEKIRVKLGCQICGDYFDHGDELKQHLSQHPPETMFKCNECEEVFSTSTSKYRHMQLTHFSFKCSKCKQKFGTDDTLREHLLKNKHKCTIKKRDCVICKICDKSLSCVDSWRRHMLLMHGIKIAAKKAKSKVPSLKRIRSQKSRVKDHKTMPIDDESPPSMAVAVKVELDHTSNNRPRISGIRCEKTRRMPIDDESPPSTAVAVKVEPDLSFEVVTCKNGAGETHKTNEFQIACDKCEKTEPSDVHI